LNKGEPPFCSCRLIPLTCARQGTRSGNPIENAFAAIKINREDHENETLDMIVSMYK
jgi:hypothetical protein